MSVDPNNNHITGVYGLTYDANGNQSGYNYDVENRISSILQGESYLYYCYDAQNRRNFSWPSTLDSMNNQNVYTVYYYTPAGQKLGAYQFNIVQNSTPTLYVTLMTSDRYFGAKRLAPQDRLGSAGDFYPWGEAKGSNNPQDNWSYATYWRDSASGLDYANNRYYSNAYGRFMTADPYGGANTRTPQSWNKYMYAGSDPVNNSDPSGLVTVIGPAPTLCTVGVGEGASDVPWDVYDIIYDLPELMVKTTGESPSGLKADVLKQIWDQLSEKCQNGLKTKFGANAKTTDMVNALLRAWSAEGTLETATQGTSIDWTMLAAIGIRESGFLDINQIGGGNAVDVLQIDLGQNSYVTPDCFK